MYINIHLISSVRTWAATKCIPERLTSTIAIEVRQVAGGGHSNFLTWHFLEMEGKEWVIGKCMIWRTRSFNLYVLISEKPWDDHARHSRVDKKIIKRMSLRKRKKGKLIPKKLRVFGFSLVINSHRLFKLFIKTRWLYNRIVALQQ